MKILVYGDLHLESQGFQPKKLWLDEADVVLQSGDLNYGLSSLRWLSSLNKKVFFVPGNHEYWNPVRRSAAPSSLCYANYGGRSFSLVEKHAADDLDSAFSSSGNDNVSVLLDKVEVFDGVRFIGTTLWFDPCGNASSVVSLMNDFSRIRSTAGVPWTKDDVAERHCRSVSFLEKELSKPFSGKTVVLTHHAPSMKSVAGLGSSPKDFLYATPLEHLVEQADLWVHGHVHKFNDYKIGKCRVLSNPRGHPSDLCRKTFAKTMFVDV